MSTTRTGKLAIGFRRMGWAWNKDLDGMLTWARGNGFSAVDIGKDGDTAAPAVLKAGLQVGSVDLAVWQGMISPDKATRDAALAKNTDYINACSKVIQHANYFLVMLPEKSALPREENFRYMVESFSLLAPVLEKTGGKLVIEGWPGAGALCS